MEGRRIVTPDQDFLSVGTFVWLLLKKIWISTLFFTIVGTLVTLVNRFYHNILSVDSAPVTLLGTLVSFMVTVKVNNDQTTWKDSRAEWSNIAANTRQLATLIWHNAKVPGPEQAVASTSRSNSNGAGTSAGQPVQRAEDLKKMCMSLLSAFPVATRYGLEGQASLARDDPAVQAASSLLPPEKPPIIRSDTVDPSQYHLDASPNEVPRDILTSLSACIATLTQQGSLPQSLLPTLETSLFSLQTSLSSLTRTSTSPPPQTSTLQTRLSVYAYLLFLPFQLNQQLGWATIPLESVVSVVYLGFMAVGADIGRPFKDGLTKLDLSGLVEDLKRQIEEIAQTQDDRERLRANVRSQLQNPATPVPEANDINVGVLVDVGDVEAQTAKPTTSQTSRYM